MMGSKQRDFLPLVHVSLDHLVPANHFYRRLDRTLDLSFVRDLVADRYASGGRPSVDPVVFFKLQLVMLFEGIRSERQLLALAADRLSVRWYLGYDLTEALPDHSSLTRIRDRFGLEIFRRFFDAVVARCIAAGLVWGAELYFDATKVAANAASASIGPRFVVEAHLAALFAADASDDVSDEHNEDLPDGVVALPVARPVEQQETLAAENAQRHDWFATAGRQQREVTHGEYRRVADFKVSATDPDASLLPTLGKTKAHPGYHTHYVVDGGKARIILAALVTPSEVMENQPMLDLLWHSRFRWQMWTRQVTGDTTYGTLENIRAIETAGMRAYIPVRDANKRAPLFGLDAFAYDPTTDRYRCPNGETLRPSTRSYTERITRYVLPARVCQACPLRTRCMTGKGGRQIQRSFDTEYLDRVRSYYLTQAYQKALRKRKVWMEPLFAEAKQWHGLRQFRLRGLMKVNSEALMVASVQNLKRLLGPQGQGKPPQREHTQGAQILSVMGTSRLPRSVAGRRLPVFQHAPGVWRRYFSQFSFKICGNSILRGAGQHEGDFVEVDGMWRLTRSQTACSVLVVLVVSFPLLMVSVAGTLPVHATDNAPITPSVVPFLRSAVTLQAQDSTGILKDFGEHVAVAVRDDLTIVVVGAPSQRAAYVLVGREGTFTLWQTLVPDVVTAYGFGQRVAVATDGTTISVVVSAPGYRVPGAHRDQGAVFLFTARSGVFMQHPLLTEDNGGGSVSRRHDHRDRHYGGKRRFGSD